MWKTARTARGAGKRGSTGGVDETALFSTGEGWTRMFPHSSTDSVTSAHSSGHAGFSSRTVRAGQPQPRDMQGSGRNSGIR